MKLFWVISVYLWSSPVPHVSNSDQANHIVIMSTVESPLVQSRSYYQFGTLEDPEKSTAVIIVL